MRQRIIYGLLALFVILMPSLVGVVLVHWVHHTSINHFAPAWSDEVYYWHQSATFADVGLNNGYYTVSENQARLDGARYYVWGPFTPALYGLLARITGLHHSWLSVLVINAALLSVAIAVYIAIVRPTIGRLLLLGLLVATFIPTIILWPTAMQQVMQQAWAFLIAAGFYVVFNQRQSSATTVQRHGVTLALAVFIMLVSLTRPTWLLFLPALALLHLRQYTVKRILLALFLSGVAMVIVAAIYQFSAPPYPHFRSDFMRLLGESIPAAFAALFDYVRENIDHLFVGGPIYLLQRVQIVVILLWGGVVWWRSRRNPDKRLSFVYLFILYHLLAAYVATIALHEVIHVRDYRVLAPHLLLTLALLLALKRDWLVIIITGSMIVFLPHALTEYATYSNFNLDIQMEYVDWNEQVDAIATYDPDAPDAWCNSVLHSPIYFTRPGLLLSFDAGLGLSWLYHWTALSQPKARYLLLTHEDVEHYLGVLPLDRKLAVPGGNLFINLTVNCEL